MRGNLRGRARIVVENVFGRIKVWWCRVLKRLDMSVENILTAIVACCIVDNLCETHEETFVERWMTELDSEEN